MSEPETLPSPPRHDDRERARSQWPRAIGGDAEEHAEQHARDAGERAVDRPHPDIDGLKLDAEQGDAARIHRRGEHRLAGERVIDEEPQAPDRRPADKSGEDLVRRRPHAQEHDHAVDDRQHGLGVVGEEIGDRLLDHDAPEQRRGEDEDLLLLLAHRARQLQPANDEIVGQKREQERDDDADGGGEIGARAQIARSGPGGDGGRDHDRAMREVEHPGHAENEGEAGRAQGVERGDREAVDQDLPDEHRRSPPPPELALDGGGFVCPHLPEAILMKDGNSSLPLASAAGHILTCLPFCHCSIRPVMKPLPVLSPCTWGSPFGRNSIRPIVLT